MSGRYSDEDHEHYERPRRRTRPRTKERPRFDDAVDGVVMTVDRGRYTLAVDDTRVVAMKSRPLGRKGVVVGDRVRVVGDVSGTDGSLARIVEVAERETVLRRTADDDDPVERIIVANATQLVVVTALADPEPRPGLIDRALVAAYDAGLPALAVPDQGRPRRPRDPAGDLPLARGAVGGHPAWWRPGGAARAAGRQDQRAVGHSGVGKSTLVNALVPAAHRDVGVVNAVTGRGRHTSTSALMLELPGGGFIVDTPGIRSFGLAHVSPSSADHGLSRPGRADRGVPARLHARRGRAGMRARPGGHPGDRRPRPGRVVPPPARGTLRADVLTGSASSSQEPQTALDPE